MFELKNYAGGLALALVASFVATADAKAACTVAAGQNVTNTQKAWPGNAYHEALRNAYAEDRCEITLDLHTGGDGCGTNSGTNHITVKTYTSGNNYKRTYHVFNYTMQDANGVTRQCSTY